METSLVITIQLPIVNSAHTGFTPRPMQGGHGARLHSPVRPNPLRDYRQGGRRAVEVLESNPTQANLVFNI